MNIIWMILLIVKTHSHRNLAQRLARPLIRSLMQISIKDTACRRDKRKIILASFMKSKIQIIKTIIQVSRKIREKIIKK